MVFHNKGNEIGWRRCDSSEIIIKANTSFNEADMIEHEKSALIMTWCELNCVCRKLFIYLVFINQFEDT